MSAIVYQRPLIEPESDWRMPTQFPDLSAAKKIAVDTETRDPHLKEKGPGFLRGESYVCGVSVCTDDLQFKGYYPIRHEEGANLPKNIVLPWLREQLGRENQGKVFAHGIYDLEALHYEGVDVKGQIHDVQTAEPLLNEETDEGYALEVLSQKYLGEGKDEGLLEDAAIAYRDGKKPKSWYRDKKYKSEMKGKLWIFPAKYVGPYAEIDAVRTMQVHLKQMPLISQEDLDRIYDIECRLIRLLLAMRLKGVPFDVEAAQRMSKEWRLKEAELLKEIRVLAGGGVDPWNPTEMVKAFERNGIAVPRTDKDNPSFENEWMAKSKHPLPPKCVEYRQLNKMRRDFVDGYQELVIKGRIHAQFHPLRRDDEGTRSGRFSCTNPNLQQVPHRNPTYSGPIRSLFIPEPGMIWIKRDYSQQEPRLRIHYANLRKMPGAFEAWKQFNDNPHTDYHQMTADMAGITRKHAKGINLGLAYGMGKEKLARQLGMTLEEAEPIFQIYHERLPYMKLLATECEKYAQARGYIRTILGRRRHFDLWEPDVPFERGKIYKAYSREKAEDIYRGLRLKRSQTRKAMNSLIQGSGADMTKMAMLTEYEEFDEVPYAQVHDELNNGVESIEHGLKLKKCMQECIPEITVPMIAEMEHGNNWGYLTKYEEAA